MSKSVDLSGAPASGHAGSVNDDIVGRLREWVGPQYPHVHPDDYASDTLMLEAAETIEKCRYHNHQLVNALRRAMTDLYPTVAAAEIDRRIMDIAE